MTTGYGCDNKKAWVKKAWVNLPDTDLSLIFHQGIQFTIHMQLS